MAVRSIPTKFKPVNPGCEEKPREFSRVTAWTNKIGRCSTAPRPPCAISSPRPSILHFIYTGALSLLGKIVEWQRIGGESNAIGRIQVRRSKIVSRKVFSAVQRGERKLLLSFGDPNFCRVSPRFLLPGTSQRVGTFVVSSDGRVQSIERRRKKNPRN